MQQNVYTYNYFVAVFSVNEECLQKCVNVCVSVKDSNILKVFRLVAMIDAKGLPLAKRSAVLWNVNVWLEAYFH